MKTSIAALALVALAGTAFADPQETQTFAGPYASYDLDDPAASVLPAAFTGANAGTPYTVVGMQIAADLTSVVAATYASEVAFEVTPPAGAVFYVRVSVLADTYTSITNATANFALPVDVSPVGAWTFKLYETFYDGDGSTGDSDVSNIRISLLSPATAPASTDLGTLGSTSIASPVAEYNGTDVKWFKVTLSDEASVASGFYVDLNTDGSLLGAGASNLANDTMIAVYDNEGTFVAYNDDFDYPDVVTSTLSFGSDVDRDHGQPGYVDGLDGDLTPGDYYIAAGAFELVFGDIIFDVSSLSESAGGSLVLNVHSNFPGGPTVCSPADVGVQGGIGGHDNVLNNNDFIVFIDLFVAHDAAADLGIQGGAAGSDGTWDNNDFIAFIDFFFNDAANCNG